MRRLIGGLALAALVMAACSPVAPSTAPSQGGTLGGAFTGKNVSGKNYKITLSTGNTADGFYITMNQGAQAAGKRLGVTVDWQATATFDPSLQIPLLNSVLTSKPDFLIATATDASALIPTFKKFKDAGIPALTIDGDVTDPGVRLGFVTTSNIEGGQTAADYIGAKLKSGKVLFLGQEPGISTEDDRFHGFDGQIKKYPNLTYLAPQFNNGDRDKVVAQLNAVLQRDPDLAAIFASDNLQQEGAVVAIRNANKSGKITLVAFDADPSQVASVRSGETAALIAQYAYAMGEISVTYAVDYLNGNPAIPARTEFPGALVTKDNVDQPAMKSVLYNAGQ